MKFGYTILYVENLEKTVAFYESAFGLKRKFVHESGYAELETGDTKLAFANFTLADSHGFKYQATSATTAPPSFEIALITDDVEAAHRKAIGAGAIEVKKPGKMPWGQEISYVRDLNGYTVEICSPVG